MKSAYLIFAILIVIIIGVLLIFTTVYNKSKNEKMVNKIVFDLPDDWAASTANFDGIDYMEFSGPAPITTVLFDKAPITSDTLNSEFFQSKIEKNGAIWFATKNLSEGDYILTVNDNLIFHFTILWESLIQKIPENGFIFVASGEEKYTYVYNELVVDFDKKEISRWVSRDEKPSSELDEVGNAIDQHSTSLNSESLETIRATIDTLLNTDRSYQEFQSGTHKTRGLSNNFKLIIKKNNKYKVFASDYPPVHEIANLEDKLRSVINKD